MGTDRNRDAERRRALRPRPDERRPGGNGDRQARRPAARETPLDAVAGTDIVKLLSRTRQESRAGWVMTGPALAAIGLFFVVPAVASLLLSFTDFDIYALADLRNLRFIGLQNYGRLIGNPLF